MERFRDLNETVYYEGEPHGMDTVYQWRMYPEELIELLESLSEDFSRWNGDYCDIWENFELNGWGYDRIYKEVTDCLQKVIDSYESLPYDDSEITIYRLLQVGGKSEIDLVDTGRHWSMTLEGVYGFISTQGWYNGMSGVLLKGTTSIDNIDWVSRALQFLCGYDFEDEYPVIDDSHINNIEQIEFRSLEEFKGYVRNNG